LHTTRPTPTTSSPRNVWHGKVHELTAQGSRMRVLVNADIEILAEITPAAAAELRLTEGTPVWAGAKATEVRFVPL
ncbi:TOBE domain-containing protein, partial [Streptomyces sp. UNOB3_S3]|uniref:TOBE domain-containing protein n=1 Tax=Streptomyces sp. UNOB3_S3 TaxID=2871682 RepID=UPI001E3C7040